MVLEEARGQVLQQERERGERGVGVRVFGSFTPGCSSVRQFRSCHCGGTLLFFFPFHFHFSQLHLLNYS